MKMVVKVRKRRIVFVLIAGIELKFTFTPCWASLSCYVFALNFVYNLFIS